MPTLDDTAKGASANSYVTVADAETYFDERYDSALWLDEPSTAQKERLLITATRELDRLPWLATRTTSTQALQWPRSGLCDRDGISLDNDTIPPEVDRATFELAYAILAETDFDTAALGNLAAFKKAKVGPLEVEMRDNVVGPSFRMPTQVKREIDLWLETSPNAVRVVRT